MPSERFRKGWHDRGYLPHRDDYDLIQHVTVHLADSLPRRAVESLEFALEELPESERAPARIRRLHELLDAGRGSCILRESRFAAIVEESLRHHEGKRYELHAWSIMPNHFHVLVQPFDSYTLQQITTAWKRYTAREIRKLLKASGAASAFSARLTDPSAAFWQREYWDRFIRDEAHFSDTIAYIHNNPVAAGLVESPGDWRWSSAYGRDGF
jgi:REP element-mobilizing transposase RayT